MVSIKPWRLAVNKVIKMLLCLAQSGTYGRQVLNEYSLVKQNSQPMEILTKMYYTSILLSEQKLWFLGEQRWILILGPLSTVFYLNLFWKWKCPEISPVNNLQAIIWPILFYNNLNERTITTGPQNWILQWSLVLLIIARKQKEKGRYWP